MPPSPETSVDMSQTQSGLRRYGHRKSISYRPLSPSIFSTTVTISDGWTVLFCGCGGESQSIRAAGGTITTASNHLEIALETHEVNHPTASHILTDISEVDPRTFPRTRFLWASPECKFHTSASGRKRMASSASLWPEWEPTESDQAQRSRATMRDVCRFATIHNYEYICVENVVEVLQWPEFQRWWTTMTEELGYTGQKVFLNSQFCSVPQSRDRLYMVFSRKGLPVPDLDIRPDAWCSVCNKQVAAVQCWKPGKTAGKFRTQYTYCCDTCGRVVRPFHVPAYSIIQWQLPITRIGDRTRPLKPKTMARIEAGLQKYGRHPLLFVSNGRDINGSLRTLDLDPLPTQTGGSYPALVDLPEGPALRAFIYSDGGGDNVYRGIEEPLQTVLTTRTFNLVGIPANTGAAWIVENGHGGPENSGRIKDIRDPLPTLHSFGGSSLCVSPYLVPQSFGGKAGHNAFPASAPLPTQSTRQDTGILLAPYIVSLRNHETTTEATEPLSTITSGGINHALLGMPRSEPFIVEYYGTSTYPRLTTEPLSTITSVHRHGLAIPQESELPNIEDCYYRTLVPYEILLGMGFEPNYTLLGTSREKVKMLGNAVTPPAGEVIIRRILAVAA